MNELKFFSTDTYNKKVSYGSPNKAIANKRNALYQSITSKIGNVRQNASQLGLFSNTTSIDMQAGTLGTTLREASISALIDSFAGYVAVESELTQMRQLLVFTDKVTKSGELVMPSLGPQSPRSLAQRTEHNVIQASDKLEVEFGCGVIPGSIDIKFIDKDKKTYSFVDDRKGNILGPAKVLEEGTIDYQIGKLVINIKADLIDTKANLDISYAKDNYVEDTNRRIKARRRYVEIEAKVNKLEYEMDLIAAAIDAKSMSSDLATDMYNSVRDEYRMACNDAMVNAIKANYAGGTTVIDLSQFSVQGGQVDTMNHVFHKGAAVVDSHMARRCYKVQGATAYIVGLGIGAFLQSMDETNYWVPNNSGFVNGLIGFYKGRAVLQHLDLADYEGYAIHKTSDGTMAPIAFGIYLPPTDLPMVGNFNNTNEVAGGLYSVDGVSTITSDLVQRFELKMPSDWMNFIN